MIELKNLYRTYHVQNGTTHAVHDVSLTINDGDIFGVIGLSGAGKSTLIRCINCLERPTSGQVLFDGVDMSKLSKKELREKRHSISMIFQDFNLLSQRTVLKNICYPLEITGVPKAKAIAKARELIEIVGLSGREGRYPSQLSGGQKQRVAIARALASSPKVLLCDEATSALDPNTTNSILDLLKSINEKMGVTIVVITHEMRVVEHICNRVAVLDRGRVVEQGLVKDIFLSPKSNVARELILPVATTVEEITAGKKIRLIFDGRSTFEPVISNLTLECRAPVNILEAGTYDNNGKAAGQMLIQLPDDADSTARIMNYLKTRELHYKEED